MRCSSDKKAALVRIYKGGNIIEAAVYLKEARGGIKEVRGTILQDPLHKGITPYSWERAEAGVRAEFQMDFKWIGGVKNIYQKSTAGQMALIKKPWYRGIDPRKKTKTMVSLHGAYESLVPHFEDAKNCCSEKDRKEAQACVVKYNVLSAPVSTPKDVSHGVSW